MGGGKAVRRRAKNAEKANVSLHKAALRKAGASAHLPLPAAPTKDDYKDRMPASLRKMLALKEAAEQPAKRRKLQNGQGVGVQAYAEQERPGGNRPGRHGQGQQQQQNEQEGNQLQSQKQAKQPAAQSAVTGGGPKKLKQKKKEYLKAKRMKKKGKHRVAADTQDMELQHDRPAFGEVVHAPPEVALKSKHWAGNTHQQQQQQHQGLHKKQQQRQHKAKCDHVQDDEIQQVRNHMIETYRATRPAPQEGQATLKSLKELVKNQERA